jgi:hypothetical protein
MGNNKGKANDVGVINHKREQIGGEKVYWTTHGLKVNKCEKRPT